MSNLDTHLRLLADERNRRILYALQETDVESLSVASDDSDERAYRHHILLPKLVAADLVDWDPRNEEVVRGPSFDEVVPLLDVIRTLDTDERPSEDNGVDGDENGA